MNLSHTILFGFVCIFVCANCDLATQARIVPTSKRDNYSWDKEHTIALLKHDLLIEIGNSIDDRNVVDFVLFEIFE